MADRNQKIGVSVVWSSPFFDLLPRYPLWLGVRVHTQSNTHTQIRLVYESDWKKERSNKMAPNPIDIDNQPTETTHWRPSSATTAYYYYYY